VVEPGRRCLGDRYELSQLIASGGMGQVWRGRDVLLGRPVAVKVLRSEYTGDSTFLARFRAEAQHAASLSHPNIAAVFDYGEAEAQDGSGESLAYLVMELVEGEPLSSVLHREGPLDVPTTLGLLQQTALALAEAHRVGMVHRDVKPGNILVRTDGSVKITDFGIAWSAGSVPLTRTGQVIGTPQYLSPEQAQGQQATPASDVYALGLVGYECLTGRSAFAGDNPVTIALKQLREQPEPLPAQLPPGVRTLITRALAKDPAQRLPDGAAFVAAVEDALAGRDLPEAPPTVAVVVPPDVAAPATGPVRMPPPRRPLVRRIALVLVPLLTLLTGAAVAAVIVHGLGAGAGSPAVAAQTQDGDGFVLVADDYLGRPVDDVAIQLSALGLSVHRRADRNSDAPAGSVTAVNPVGVRLHVGDVVTIRYALGSGEPARRSSAEQRQQAARGSLVADTSQTPGMEVAGGTGVGPAATTSAPSDTTTPTPPSDTTTPTPPSDTSGTTPPTDSTTPPTDSTTPPADTTPPPDAGVTP
jgi:eukaryotic-like serine/threonine-protein kinase